MAYLDTRPYAKLGEYVIYNFHVTEEVNHGVKWDAALPGFQDVVALAELVYSLKVFDGRDFSYTTPPLVANLGVEYACDLVEGEVTLLSGQDQCSWKLSQPNQSLLTFKNLKANTIIDAIAAASGVTIKAPLIDFSVAEEDVKQSNWWDPLARIAEVACMNMMVNATGQLVFVPLKTSGQLCIFKPERFSRRYDKSRKITGFTIVKRTSHYTAANAPLERFYNFDTAGYKFQELRTPLLNPQPRDLSQSGTIDLVSFWTGNPTSPSSQMISSFAMNSNFGGIFAGIPTVSGVATWVALNVRPPAPPFENLPVVAKVEISGSSPPLSEGEPLPGLDLSFVETIGTIEGAAARPGPVRNESLYPSRAYVLLHAPELLWEANKGLDVISCSGPIDCLARAGGKLLLEAEHPAPTAKIERMEHTGNAEGFSTSLSGFVIPW